MATGTLAKHGSEAGYNAERATGNICERCRAAHRVWSRRKGIKGKREGLGKYTSYDVIDHLDLRRQPRAARATLQTTSAPPSPRTENSAMAAPPTVTDPSAMPELAQEAPAGPSLGDRLAERLRAFTSSEPEANPYVAENDFGDVHPIDSIDESPGPEWEPVEDSDYIIGAKALEKIQDNLGTYLSVVGMTFEMLDPYCGPILAANFDNMVTHWSKVIAHYPKAAELFLDGKGGIIFTWIGAIQASWPFLYAIYQHHLARTITVAPNGQVFRKGQQPNPNGQAPSFDSLTPEFQYSAT